MGNGRKSCRQGFAGRGGGADAEMEECTGDVAGWKKGLAADASF